MLVLAGPSFESLYCVGRTHGHFLALLVKMIIDYERKLSYCKSQLYLCVKRQWYSKTVPTDQWYGGAPDGQSVAAVGKEENEDEEDGHG